MSQPLISVIIPVYKVEKYLSECLNSIIYQTFKNIEIIIIDDGSPDTCPQICDDFSNMDDRIKVVHKKNEGVSIARSIGVDLSIGKYITFCDSDDKLDIDALEKVFSIIDKYNPDIITFQSRREEKKDRAVDSFGKLYRKKDIIEEIYPILLENKFCEYYDPSIWGKVYKRDLYIKNQVKNKRIVVGEDIACCKPCLYHAKSIFVINESLYYYRKNTESVILSKNVYPLNDPQLIAEHISEHIDIHSFDMQEQLYRVITHQLFNVVLSQFNKDDSYINVSKIIRHTLKIPYYENAIKNCKYAWTNIKGNVVRYSLKYKLITVIWIINKIKNKLKK